jgi:hypothetical protein
MIFKKYTQFLDQFSINENLDKAKKYMKDRYILTTAATQLNLIDDETKYDMSNGNKRSVTPLDFVKLDPEKRKELTDVMRGISVSDEQLRDLISTNEFKQVREIKTSVPVQDVNGNTIQKEYQLDRDHMGWLGNFVYFYYYENASLPDLYTLYKNLILNKDILANLEISTNGKLAKKAFDTNYINMKVPNNMELLIDGLNRLENLRLYKKMEADLPPHLKRDLKDSPQIIKDQFLEVAMAFDALGGDDKEKHDELYKGFWGRMLLDDREGSKTKGQIVFRSPVSRYKNIRDLIEKALGYAKASDNDGFNTFYKRFQDCGTKFGAMGAEEVFNENGIFIIEVKSFGANRILNAGTSHCIKDSLGQWDYYVNSDRNRRQVEENKQYYIYNFNLMGSNSLSVIGITIEPDDNYNHIRAAHNKIDGNVAHNVISILKGWGTEYDIEDDAKTKAKELGATDAEISKYGGLFALLRPATGEDLEKRRKARAANIEIVKKGITIEQIKQYVTVDGADINREACKALQHAVQENDLEKAQLILSLGGSPNLKPPKEGVINDATSLDMIKLLVKNGSELTAQVYNNICHDLEAVKFCLDNGLDPSFEDSLPVRRSCKGSYVSPTDIGECYLDGIKMLLDYGASLTDKRGRYMIIKWAIEYGRTEVIDYVIENGGTMGFASAYTWLGHSRKLTLEDRKKLNNEYLMPLILKYEKEEFDALPENKLWHLK